MGRSDCATFRDTLLIQNYDLQQIFYQCRYLFQLKADVLDEAPSGEQSVGYFCVVRIELGQELCADGVGIAQQNWSLAGSKCV